MIGIIILNYNNWNDTKVCIKSILSSYIKEKYKIYLVDNHSIKKPDRQLMELIKRNDITLIINKTNLGYAAGNNVGINQALNDNCDAILISNNDVKFLKNSIQRLYQFLYNNPKVGIVGPKIIDKKGYIQKSNLCMKTGKKEKYIIRTRLHTFFPQYNSKYWGLNHNYNNEIFHVYAVLGCCFMMSRECALKVTPFDENTFLYEEELILGIHMEKEGYLTIYYPRAVIYHLHGKSTEQVKAFSFRQMIKSEIYYCKYYLKCKNWEIYPLYLYRVILYLIRSIQYSDFRENWNIFLKETREEFKKSYEKNL